ncbi:hypothetical protein ACFE04_028030 [Oxalis oulophora]
MLKKNLSKLHQAMVFQRSNSNNKQKANQSSFSKEKNDDIDDNSGGDAPHHHPSTTNQLSLDATYNSWLVDHPSALSSFERMMKEAKGKKIVVFLDYDGTLSPIVNDPDSAFMSDEMRAAVHKVAKCFPTAIISGRSRDKVKEFVKLSNVYYAGSHGMDILAPSRVNVKSTDGKNCLTAIDNQKGSEVLFQPAKKFLPEIQEIFAVLEKETRKIQGARVEDNKFCISVHYRQVQEEDYETLEKMVKSVLEKYSDFRLCEGKKVMELRPSIEWDKGHALEYLLESLGFSNTNDVLPLYIGDDRTDEDAFKVIKSRGQGYPIIVSHIPKDTIASYSLCDPSEVLTFLRRLARWRRNSSSRSMSQIWGVEGYLNGL